jgi:hypothetical protein
MEMMAGARLALVEQAIRFAVGRIESGQTYEGVQLLRRLVPCGAAVWAPPRKRPRRQEPVQGGGGDAA